MPRPLIGLFRSRASGRFEPFALGLTAICAKLKFQRIQDYANSLDLPVCRRLARSGKRSPIAPAPAKRFAHSARDLPELAPVLSAATVLFL
jgi:hypothetical protein